jgi:hypothetical protein
MLSPESEKRTVSQTYGHKLIQISLSPDKPTRLISMEGVKYYGEILFFGYEHDGSD